MALDPRALCLPSIPSDTVFNVALSSHGPPLSKKTKIRLLGTGNPSVVRTYHRSRSLLLGRAFAFLGSAVEIESAVLALFLESGDGLCKNCH